MTLQTSFQAVQLTRYGMHTNPQDQRVDPDEPLCRQHARTIYEILYEYPTSRVESYYIPAHRRLNHFLRVVPSIDHDAESYHDLLGIRLVDELPEHIELSRVNVDLQPTGTTPAPTHRLLVTSNASPWKDGYIETGHSLVSKLLKQLTANTRPYILKVVARKTAADDLEVALWMIDYSPPTDWQSPGGVTPTQREHSLLSPGTVFCGPHLTTKIEIPDAYDGAYWADLVSRHDDIYWNDTVHPQRKTTRPSKYNIELRRSSGEYAVAHSRGIPNGSPTESRSGRPVCEPWLRLDSEQLPAFGGLLAVYYPESPWMHTPDRSPPAVEPERYYQRV